VYVGSDGLQLTPKRLFEFPTIAQLAAVTVRGEDSTICEQELIEGESPLTLIQHWFVEQQLADSHHYNQAFMLDVREPLEESALRQAITVLERHHDVLRLRLRRDAGIWIQQFAAADSVELPFAQVDLSAVADEQLPAEITKVSMRYQSSLDIEQGPVWRVLYIGLGEGRGRRLLVIVHHLAVDGVSWHILIQDLETGYRQAQRGEEVQLSAKTTSFKYWAERLQRYAESKELAEEASHWESILALGHQPLPADGLGGENIEANTEIVTVRLTAGQTHDLLQGVPRAYNTVINDVLLTALAQSMEAWTGHRQLLVNVEGHGREDVFDGVDLSRTVGWFTTIYPVQLELPVSRAPQDALKAVKEQLRSVPRRGFGYGVQRYLGRVSSPLSEDRYRCPEPDVLFNYLGRFDDVVSQSQLFAFADESPGEWHSQRRRRRHLLEINGMVIRGCLEFQWTYSSASHRSETVEKVADDFIHALRNLIQHCISPEQGGYTPSDFPLCGLDQPTLDRVVGDSRDIEDIYPLSPIQLLFLARAANQHNSVLDHWQCTLVGRLDVDLFRRAWDDVLACHSVLRSSFLSDDLREPVQVVRRRVRASWTLHDWSSQQSDWQAEQWELLLREDHAIGTALDQLPLSRFTLVRLDADRHRFLWSVPALLLDGWSWPLVFADLSKAYEGHLRNETAVLEKPRSYREYLNWLRRHTMETNPGVPDDPQNSDGPLHPGAGEIHREFWRKNLAGVTEPTPLAAEYPSDSQPNHSDPFHGVSCQLDSPTVEKLRKTIRHQRTTVGALIYAAWSVVLSRLSGRRDVVFGAAFSGRPTDVAGAESMVGPFGRF
jgi:non-ribosomal peptide synthase protein (TIGR01720 family)